MLLIYPPVVRSTEPPLGIARLAGFLRSAGKRVSLLDLNHEGLQELLVSSSQVPVNTGKQDRAGTWLRGALGRKDRNLASLRDLDTYQNLSRYQRIVGDLNQVLRLAGKPFGAEIGLANYSEHQRSPVLRKDLLDAAAKYSDNTYFIFFSRRISEELAKGSCSLVGLSINYLSQALPAFAILGWLSQAYPEIRRIAGGGLINSWLSQGSLSVDERFEGLVDALFSGLGEEALLGWADLDLGEAKGIKPGFPKLAPRAAVPEFEDFNHLSYLSPVSIIPYSFSSGCPWKRCTFCPETAEGGRYIGLPLNTALAQLDAIARRYRPGLFHLTDNEVSPLYLRGLTEKGPGLPWYGFARFSDALLDPGFCRALASSGCRMLQLGLESADQRVLDTLGKGTDLGRIDTILVNLAQAGIGTYLYVLFGTPSEDLIAARRTKDYLSSRANLINFLNIAIFNLPARSGLAGQLVTRNFYKGDLSLYVDFEHTAGFGREVVRQFIKREVQADPKIWGILKKSPPVFTSNHGVFFLDTSS